MSIEISYKNIEISPIGENEAFKQLDKYAGLIVQELGKQGLSREDTLQVLNFIFYQLAPAFEQFLVDYLKKNKNLNLRSEDITLWDKNIFPNGTSDFIKYLKLFISEWQKGNIQVYSNSDNNENLQPRFKKFLKMYPYIKPYFLKFMELSIASINVLNRNNRVKVKEDLDKLQKEIK